MWRQAVLSLWVIASKGVELRSMICLVMISNALLLQHNISISMYVYCSLQTLQRFWYSPETFQPHTDWQFHSNPNIHFWCCVQNSSLVILLITACSSKSKLAQVKNSCATAATGDSAFTVHSFAVNRNSVTKQGLPSKVSQQLEGRVPFWNQSVNFCYTTSVFSGHNVTET